MYINNINNLSWMCFFYDFKNLAPLSGKFWHKFILNV